MQASLWLDAAKDFARAAVIGRTENVEASGWRAVANRVVLAVGSPQGIFLSGLAVAAILGAWILVMAISPAVTRDELPRNPVLRFATLFAFLMSALWLGFAVRKIRRAGLRLVGAIGLAGGIWFFLGGLADLDHLLINQYGWPRAWHQYFHVSEVASASAVVLAGLGLLLTRSSSTTRSVRVPQMGLLALFGSFALLANLIAAASFFRWTPYRDLVTIAFHVPWAWTASAVVGIGIFVALLGAERLRISRMAAPAASATSSRDEPLT